MNESGAPSGATPKLLRRSRTRRMLAGVCGGIAEYLSIDATVVRVIVAVLAVFGGSGAVLYLAGWLLIPDEGEEQSIAQRYLTKRT